MIGWGPEIPKLSRALAIEFYNRFYAPNNAILVVAGDVTEAEVRKLAQETFGRVKPRAGLVRPPRPVEPPQVAASPTVSSAEKQAIEEHITQHITQHILASLAQRPAAPTTPPP